MSTASDLPDEDRKENDYSLGACLKIDFLKTDPSCEAPIQSYLVQCACANDGTAPMIGILRSIFFSLSTFI